MATVYNSNPQSGALWFENTDNLDFGAAAVGPTQLGILRFDASNGSVAENIYKNECNTVQPPAIILVPQLRY